MTKEKIDIVDGEHSNNGQDSGGHSFPPKQQLSVLKSQNGLLVNQHDKEANLF